MSCRGLLAQAYAIIVIVIINMTMTMTMTMTMNMTVTDKVTFKVVKINLITMKLL